jgi:chemotaxis signal transduction protein
MDLGIRFGIKAVSAEEDKTFLVYENDGTSMAAMVSCVESVVTIEPSAITKEFPAESLIPREAMDGIARVKEHLIPIVRLNGLIDKAISA